MRFRPFRNTDPPHLARIWSQQPPQRGFARSITPQLLDIYVLSKPFFDRQGLIVAEEGGEIIGFVHAGFGPNEQHSDISHEMGVTCMLMVDPGADFEAVAPQLLAESEAFLRGRGAQLLYAGCIYPLNPFYLGLYGGSESPGVLASDINRVALYQQHGYQEVDQVVVLQRPLAGFRIPIDRRLMQLRRQYRVELDSTPPSDDWWDACVQPPGNPTRFELIANTGTNVCGSVRFWVIETMSSAWGTLAVGLTNLEVEEASQRQGLATFLNGEALKHLQMNGVGLVEAQTMHYNSAAIGLYKKLGFQDVDHGIVFRKT